MQLYDGVAQLIGFCGTAAYLLSFQVKRNRHFFLMQLLGSLFFVINFMMLGAWAGAMMNLLNIVRCLLLTKGGVFRHRGFLWAILAATAAISAATVIPELRASGWTRVVAATLCALIGQIAGNLAMWSDNGRIMRYAQLLAVSPMWLLHNVLVFSLGGIVCELGNLTSTAISILRFRKSGFDGDGRT